MFSCVFIDESVLMCVNRMKNTMQTIEQSELKKKMNANSRRGHQSIKKIFYLTHVIRNLIAFHVLVQYLKAKKRIQTRDNVFHDDGYQRIWTQ